MMYFPISGTITKQAIFYFILFLLYLFILNFIYFILWFISLILIYIVRFYFLFLFISFVYIFAMTKPIEKY